MHQQIFNRPEYKERRVELRQNQTEPEKLLWQHIRNQQLGVKFRRQHSVDNYILDFFAKEINLAVEVDGDSHFTDDGIAYDKIRTEFLNSLNIDVIRFTNQQVMQNVIGVCEVLTGIINERLATKKTNPL